jgi:hypothetical protein
VACFEFAVALLVLCHTAGILAQAEHDTLNFHKGREHHESSFQFTGHEFGDGFLDYERGAG